MNKQGMLLLITAIMLVVAGVHAGVHTESFADYSGYDPYQSTALWNTHSNRLEIHRIQDSYNYFPYAVIADEAGGYFSASIDMVGAEAVLTLQHYDSNGFPVFPVPGIVLLTGGSYMAGDMTLLSDGDLLLTWTYYGDHSVYAQRYTPDAMPVWPVPLQINDSPVGSNTHGVVTASLPGNNAVIAYLDDRTGDRKAYIQRINGSGVRQWANDVKIQSDNAISESGLQISTSDVGMIFLCFEQSGIDVDIGLTRMTMNGVVSWDPAIIANLDTALDQRVPSMCLINNTEVYLAWREYDGGNYYVDVQHWHDDGTCDLPTDQRVVNHTELVNNLSIKNINPDNIMLSFSTRQSSMNLLANVVFTQDLIPFSPPSAIVPPSNAESLGTVFVDTSPTGGAFYHWMGISDFFFQSYNMMTGNLGQPLWPEPRKTEKHSHDVMKMDLGFTRNSGEANGFKCHWVDNRSHSMHTFATEFTSLLGQAYLPKQIDQGSQALASKTAEAPDGTTVAAWYTRESDQRELQLMWYDTSWNPIWSQPINIAEYSLNLGISSFNVDIDHLGRACIVWSNSSGDLGTYFQIVTPDRQLVNPTPIRADNGVLAGSFMNANVVPGVTDGLMITWVDNTSGDTTLYARRFNNDGNPSWIVPLEISFGPVTSVLRYDLVRDADSYCVAVIIRDGSDYTVRRARFDDGGGFLEAPQVISSIYSYIYYVSAELMNGDIYIVWDGENVTDISVYGQKLVNGAPVWIDKPLTATSYDVVSGLDLITTNTNALAFMFIGTQGFNNYTLIQEINSLGNTTFGSEQQTLIPNPYIYDFEYGISSRLNSGEDVHWAMVTETTADPRGGVIQYWLSNDGGITWYQTEVGLPLVFPTAGNDLRFSADLYAEPHQQVSPAVTSITTQWNESQVATDIVLNQSLFDTGDNFRLAIRHSNSGSSVLVDKYILLDVYGMYWWWPSWSEAIDSSSDSISSGFTEDVIFEFPWPADTGSATDLRFWAALLEPGTSNLVGPWDYVTFGYN